MQIDGSIKKILDDHEKRILHLETLIGKQKSPPAPKKRKKLTDHILDMRDKGFFSRPKTAPEVHKELQGIYHCEPDRVAMALLRLSTRKELRKATKKSAGKIYKAYVW
jgi:hypothetical protein